MRFSENYIEKVKEANNLVDIIGQHTQLKPMGAQHLGLCPYPNHNEKTPSFSVSEPKQVYYCFGCKSSGNIFSFLKDIKGFSFTESIEYLANRASIPLPKSEDSSNFHGNQNTKSKQIYQEKKKNLSLLNKYVSEFYHKKLLSLANNHPVRSYLKSRGLNEDIMRSYQIGYSDSEWQGLTHYLKNKKVPLAWAEELGLLKFKKEAKDKNLAESFFDIFRDRIIFPIVSHKEEYVGFGGRIINEGQPKYLNSPESAIFSKGKILFGLNESAKFIRSNDFAIIVEGYMDQIALSKSGFKNSAATLGTALTEAHAKLLSRYTKNILILFDGDEAGQTAAKRSLPILLKEGLLPKALILPDKLDPDDYLNTYGPDALRALIRTAPDLYQVVLNKLLEGYSGSATDKIKLIEKIAPYLRSAKDSRLKSLYYEELKERLFVSDSWLKSAILSTKTQTSNTESPASSTLPKKELDNNFNSLEMIAVSSASLAEIHFLNICLMNEKYLKRALDTQFSSQLSNSGIKKIFEKIEDHYRQFPSKFDRLTDLLMLWIKDTSLLTKQFESELTQLSEAELDQYFKDCMDKIKKSTLKSKARLITQNLKGKSTQEQIKELEQFMNIQNSKLELQKN